ncbi:MAG: hypothetical protein KAQ68_11670 [Clostridiales bacterium]|nr:hypothetical protein [Clostridiales bacterium]
MKKIKRILALLLLITISTMMFPTIAYAATDFEITSISPSPSTISIGGGSVNVSYTLKNTGTITITGIECYFWLPSGTIVKAHSTSIAVGASKTFTDSINFKSNDVNQAVNLVVWNTGPMFDRSKTFTVVGEENVIRSGSEISPDKDTYFVGETVSVTDTMRNSIGVDVTDLDMKYYFRRSDGNTDGDTVNFATITPNQMVENTIKYTFTDADLGGLRIGSAITYHVSGNGPYTEYNVAHDFDVVPSPTPTASPTPTPTLVPTPTQAPTEETQALDVITPVPEETDSNVQENQSIGSTILGDRGLLLTLIILAGVIVILILVVVIVLIIRKK